MNTIELKPACKDYLWGGEKLRDNYGIDSPLHPLAEAWMLSCHPDGPSMVASGPHAGKTFPAYIEQWAAAAWAPTAKPSAISPS